MGNKNTILEPVEQLFGGVPFSELSAPDTLESNEALNRAAAAVGIIEMADDGEPLALTCSTCALLAQHEYRCMRKASAAIYYPDADTPTLMQCHKQR